MTDDTAKSSGGETLTGTPGAVDPRSESLAARSAANVSDDARMKALLSGGPAEGVVETTATTADGRVWTINVVHVNCACKWCAVLEGDAVEHVYERRDDDVFMYRESREPSDA